MILLCVINNMSRYQNMGMHEIPTVEHLSLAFFQCNRRYAFSRADDSGIEPCDMLIELHVYNVEPNINI